MNTFLATLILSSFIPAIPQKSVTEYTPAQRAALQAFIAKNSAYQFIPETWFEEAALKAARSESVFGKSFKPYYQTGDFNRDGKRDFAVILLTGKNVSDPESRMNVVVFNGSKGGSYRVAHIEHEDFSTALFIHVDRNTLYVGVMETDSTGCFVPAGRGYIVEPCGA
jgi:ethanolamine utilization microcompartment shell protein EutL